VITRLKENLLSGVSFLGGVFSTPVAIIYGVLNTPIVVVSTASDNFQVFEIHQ
jgi:hypothetical protein